MRQPASPYKGLRFYQTEDTDIFAAREKDAVACARLLAGRASVLMLHGRTGCGKSSFLRAALRPLLERVDTGLYFPQLPGGGFRVVRSGQTPLREIAAAVFDLVHDLKIADPAGADDLDAVLGDFRAPGQRADFVAAYGEHFERTVRALTRLGEAAAGTPILVIDQAEEIFTLFDVSVPDDAADGPKESEEEKTRRNEQEKARRIELLNARIEYMNLLRTVAITPMGVKLLVSLRTEYKGLFEDELRRELSAEAGGRLTGFHLDDLDFNGLVEAITKPTRLKDSSGNPVFPFRYESDEVPRTIAKRLTARDAVPMGGVLPTLQVVCSRLYEQVQRSKGRATGGTWSIQMTDLERLGSLDNQVEVYLRERLEEMIVALGTENPPNQSARLPVEIDRTTEIDKWYRLLDKLVQLQGDGRAVTKQIPKGELEEEARKLQCKYADGAWAYLSRENVGILRAEQKGTAPYWTLGHDSLGLALQKWSVTYKDALDPGMRMDMNSPRQAAKLTAVNLHPNQTPPAEYELDVPVDALWDHQIPFFAQVRNLSCRIGVNFREAPGLTHPFTSTSRVLVAAERAAFPPKEHLAQWTDVAVSDLFQGNGLVGPPSPELAPIRMTNVSDDEELRLKMEEALRRVLRHLSAKRATLLSYDKSARSMMRLAAFLCGLPSSLVDADLVYDHEFQPSRGRDELFERLAARNHDDSVFMIGTAFGRALASHRGYRTYFDTQDLTKLIDLQLKRARADGDSPEAIASIRAAFRLYRESAFHTVWQVNIPSAEWRHIKYYPLIMRLAGLCYFTADYVRSFPDDLVRHLYDWHARRFDISSRVSRETIRETLRDCFVFLSFDENPRLLFDPDSRYEFNPREAAAADGLTSGARMSSKVRQIHIELTTLRRRTVDLFDRMCVQVEQLENFTKTAESEALLREAEVLRGCAWDNFRIYNFYDSARQMERALRIVGDVVAATMNEVWTRE